MAHSGNLLLDSISSADYLLLHRHLRPVELRVKLVLFEAGEDITHVHFPVDAIISIVVPLKRGEAVEAAMVGRDGVVGASAALDSGRSLSRGMVQLGGKGLMCSPLAFRSAVEQSRSLMSLVVRHEQTLYAQVQQSVACMANHRAEQRLCRWMLRAHDLFPHEDLPFTQEFLGNMLGLRRTSVSEIAAQLQQRGLINYTRGKVKLLDIAGIEKASCECYGAVKAYYAALLSPLK
jgi:CRP-like cAMP-binding protein